MVTDLRERLVLLEVLVGEDAGAPIRDQAKLLTLELLRCAEELDAAVAGAASEAVGSIRSAPPAGSTAPGAGSTAPAAGGTAGAVESAVADASSVRVTRSQVEVRQSRAQPRRPARTTRRQRSLLRGTRAPAPRRALRHRPDRRVA